MAVLSVIREYVFLNDETRVGETPIRAAAKNSDARQ